MICKYCGVETQAQDGICKACKYKLKFSPNESGVDIFSSSGNAEEVKTQNAAPKINYFSESEEVPLSHADYLPVKTRKPRLRKGFVAVVVAAFLIILAVVLYLAGVFKTATSKIKESLESGNYSAAYATFQSEFTEEGSTSLNKLLEQRLDSLYGQYSSGDREYTDVREEYDTIEKMGIIDLKKKVNGIGLKLSDMKKSKNGFEKAEKYYSKQNYALSIKEYAKVIKDDSNYSIAERKAKQARANYRNTVLSEAATLVTNGDYNAAVKLLESALEILEKDELIEKRMAEYGKSETTKSRQEILDTADEYAFNDDYAAAITVIMTALESNEDYSTDETIMNNLEDYRELYTDWFSEEIDEYISEGNYEKAAELLEEADRVIPKSKTAADKKQQLEGRMPKYLHELTPDSEKKWSWGKGESVDSFGSDHSGEANYILLGADSKATYDLGGDYESFKCSLVASKDIDPSAKCKVEITATVGGEYLYREWEISSETEEQEVTMITKDCTSLTISISGEGAEVLMFDARLAKE